jgi:hypothetical protein
LRLSSGISELSLNPETSKDLNKAITKRQLYELYNDLLESVRQMYIPNFYSDMNPYQDFENRKNLVYKELTRLRNCLESLDIKW